MSAEILIVDDEADIRMLIAGALEDEGYTTREAGSDTAALESIRARAPALVLLDIWLEGSQSDGIDILETIKRDNPDLPVLMISGHGNVEIAVNAIKKGAYDFIEKPFKIDRLLILIERAIEAARLKRENSELRIIAGDRSELIGESAQISHLRQTIEKVGPTNSRVLISGPAGVGKEVVARLLHAQSHRSTAPFVVLNCATPSTERLESALLGEEPNESDGARKVGLLEQAHGGTLLLDEVGDMPWETQGKIVRILQEQKFRRIGGDTDVEIDARVIATSTRDLQEWIDLERFREDLYYRLRVVPIDIPPLRDRREDVPALARHLMSMAATRAGLIAREFADDALAALQSYHWPGNVRQLSNVIDWVLIMTPPEDAAPISAKMLPPDVTGATITNVNWDRTSEMMSLPMREARDMFEREYLLAQMARFGGNISRTAAFVGMERSALHRKMKSLGVQGPIDRDQRRYDA